MCTAATCIAFFFYYMNTTRGDPRIHGWHTYISILSMRVVTAHQQNKDETNAMKNIEIRKS